MSVRFHFPARTRGILIRYLRQGRVTAPRRCPWSSFSCTSTGHIEQNHTTRLSLSVYQLKGCSEPEKLKTSWASKSVQNKNKTIRDWQLFGFRAPRRLLRLPHASQGRCVCLEVPVWSCLFGLVCELSFGTVCLELFVWSCLFGAFCLDLSVCLFGGRLKLKMRQATKRAQNTYMHKHILRYRRSHHIHSFKFAKTSLTNIRSLHLMT